MTNTRILLIHGDRLLQEFFREAVEQGGFSVDVRNNLDDAQSVLSERKPAVILLDLVHQHGRAANFVKLLRADPSTEHIPVLILPSALHELANAVMLVGATKIIEPGGNLIASIITDIKVSLGQIEPSRGTNFAFFRMDESWTDSVFAEAVRTINQMRHCLPGLTSTPPESGALRGLWFLVHSFAQRALFVANKPLRQFLGALDLLMHDLNEAPDQINPSTLRTIGQALDFLATIANPDALDLLADPTEARILIVDDEPGALQFISAALHLAGLKAETADAPSVCLEKLQDGHWDLIFLDIGLPEVDGFELCTRIRAIEKLETTPIVFITGMTSFKNKATACLSGGNDFVGKPFNLCELGVKALKWLYCGELELV
jgi:DNA-binding response OmpR family regulator